MRLLLAKLFIFPALLLFSSAALRAQGCLPSTINGTTINLACNQTCQNLVFQIPHIKSTADYNLLSVPYTPYPYTSPSGIEDPVLYADDQYSAAFNLPFQFCFFGATYGQAVIGSNGIMTFDRANAAPCQNGWQITQPIPFAGGSPCASLYYPRASIMGAYSDLDPRTIASPADRKISWFIVGTAPCRKFIVSYYHIGVFGSVCGFTTPNTFQMVIHESTGIVEIFTEQKACFTSTNAGRAILGIQNWDQNQAIAAPGKNNATWSENNTGYRFIPSGGTSRYISSQLLTMTGTLVATADTSTVTAGLLNLSFLNFCPPSGSNQYRVVTTFSACDNPGNNFITEDTITVNRNNTLNATATATNTACGPPTGSITVTVPPTIGTPPYTFVLDGTITQTGASPMTFTNVGANAHTVVVTDASGGCTSTINITVNQTNNLTANIAAVPAACPGVNNGVINVTPTNGTGPYTFVLNPGAVTQTGATASFTGLAAGAYTVSVTDASSCVTVPVLSATVGSGTGLSANLTQTSTTCAGANNGTITAAPTNGTGPYTFVLDGTITQTGATTTFTNLSAGIHTIAVTDASGCITNPALSITVASGATLAATFTQTTTSCSGATNGTATINPTNGAAPYTFVLDGTITQTGAVTTFINLSAGIHTVVVTDAAGCVSNPLSITITAGPALTTSVNKTDALCNGSATGTITVTQPAIGTPPYEYSLDGIVWQTANTFTGLLANTYTVRFREANGCQGSQTITVAEPPLLAATNSTSAVICNGQNNGVIIVAATGGVSPYQYSINGGATWQATGRFDVAAGNYTVTVRDVNNCLLSLPAITVTEPAALTGAAATANASCDGGNDGVITVTAGGGNSGYQYSLDGINFQAANTFNVAPGNYIITVKDNLNCTTSFNTTVGLTNNLTVTPQTDITICEGTSRQLQSVSNATAYSWSPAAGLSAANISNPVADPKATIQYIVTATLGRCSANDTVIVNVNAAPAPDAGPDGVICYGQTYQLQASGGTVFNWSPSTYLSSNTASNPVVNPEKTIAYTLSVIDANGCASLITDQVLVDVTPPIKVVMHPFDTVGYPGDKFKLRASSVATDYLWSPSTGLNNPAIADPEVTVGNIGDDIIYKVTASTIAGCKGDGFVRLRVYKGPEIYTPTAFTPNGDGKNDKFYPFPVGIKRISYFRVYNRYGQLVFSSTTLHEGWDGKISGREQSTGVYVWVAEAVGNDNKVITKKGTVTLIR